MNNERIHILVLTVENGYEIILNCKWLKMPNHYAKNCRYLSPEIE